MERLRRRGLQTPWILDPGSRARPPGQLCPPPSFLSPESGRPGCGRAAAPAPCSGMGQVEASLHGGCCQDSVYACAQVHVALEGQGLPARFLTLPRHRRAAEPRIRALAFVYKQLPGRALRESAVVLTWLQEAWMYFVGVFVRGRLWGWPQCDILEVRAAHLCWCTVSAGVLPGVPCVSGGVPGIKVSCQSQEASSPGQVGGGGGVVSLSPAAPLDSAGAEGPGIWTSKFGLCQGPSILWASVSW